MALSASRFHCLQWTGLAKLMLDAITAGSASLHTRRCRLMDQFQTLEKFQSECLIFIDKGYHEIVIPDHTFTFCTKQPATREVRF